VLSKPWVKTPNLFGRAAGLFCISALGPIVDDRPLATGPDDSAMRGYCG
jgi:hypothetical protein